MKTWHIVGWVLTLGMQSSVLAYNGSVDFTLDSSTGPGQAGSQWITNNDAAGSLLVRDHTVGGNLGLYQSFNSWLIRPELLEGAAFGQVETSLSLPVSGISASAYVTPGSMGVSWSAPHPQDFVETHVSWNRVFRLDPNASVTLSGLATLVSSEPAEPFPHYLTQAATWPRYGVSTAILYVRDDDPWNNGIRNGIELIGTILDTDPTLPGAPLQGRTVGADDFSYSADSFGHLSLTMFNHSDLPLFGMFYIHAYAGSPALGVPEPATWATMLLGLLLMAFTVRGGGADYGP